jgi:hypothetical protein
LGHSEGRQNYYESDFDVNKKIFVVTLFVIDEPNYQCWRKLRPEMKFNLLQSFSSTNKSIPKGFNSGKSEPSQNCI